MLLLEPRKGAASGLRYEGRGFLHDATSRWRGMRRVAGRRRGRRGIGAVDLTNWLLLSQRGEGGQVGGRCLAQHFSHLKPNPAKGTSFHSNILNECYPIRISSYFYVSTFLLHITTLLTVIIIIFPLYLPFSLLLHSVTTFHAHSLILNTPRQRVLLQTLTLRCLSIIGRNSKSWSSSPKGLRRHSATFSQPT